MFASLSFPLSVCCQTRRYLICSFVFFFFQKLDEGRFGIQPVDDDDGTVSVLFFFFFWGHKQLSERRMWLVQETLNQEPCAAEPYILSKLHFVSISSLFIYLFMYLFI